MGVSRCRGISRQEYDWLNPPCTHPDHDRPPHQAFPPPKSLLSPHPPPGHPISTISHTLPPTHTLTRRQAIPISTISHTLIHYPPLTRCQAIPISTISHTLPPTHTLTRRQAIPIRTPIQKWAAADAAVNACHEVGCGPLFVEVHAEVGA